MSNSQALMGFFDQSGPLFFFIILYFLVKHDRDFKHLRELLNNHITDTNKKIEQLSSRFDKLNDRIDNLSNRFDRLYEILIKDKKN